MGDDRSWQQSIDKDYQTKNELFGDLQPGRENNLLFNRFDNDRFEQERLGLLPRDRKEAGAIIADDPETPANGHFRKGLKRTEEARNMISALPAERREVLQKLQLDLCKAPTVQEKNRLRSEMRREFSGIYGKMDEAKEELLKGV